MKTIKDQLEGKKIFTISPSETIYNTILYMAENNVGLLPVLNEGKLVGVFSERDLVKRVIAKNLDINTTKVEDVMTKNLILADINESHEVCLKKMNDAKIRHILIINGDKLAGVLSLRDLLEIDLTVQKETVEVLNSYIYSK